MLQDSTIAYNGQPIALVVAKTLNDAKAAAAMLKIGYSPQFAKLQWEKRLGEARWPKNPGKEPAGNHRGDVENEKLSSIAVFRRWRRHLRDLRRQRHTFVLED